MTQLGFQVRSRALLIGQWGNLYGQGRMDERRDRAAAAADRVAAPSVMMIGVPSIGAARRPVRFSNAWHICVLISRTVF